MTKRDEVSPNSLAVADLAMKAVKVAPPLSVSFLPPYKSDSDQCTAVRMIRAGFAAETPCSAIRGVLLSPAGDQELTIKDLDAAKVHGLHLLDGPWETLESHALNYRRGGGLVRRLPISLEPFNEYYRKHNPRYFHSDYRFSTVEAASYALAVLGFSSAGHSLAETFGFGDAFLSNFASFAP
ncbi:MAG: ribosome biogenesis domain-containing protein [Bacteroidota bacterium]